MLVQGLSENEAKNYLSDTEGEVKEKCSRRGRSGGLFFWVD